MKQERPDSDIFQAYDIRGHAPQELNAAIAYLVGRAMVTFTGAKKLLVGQDMRTTSKELATALIQGIRDQGADVIDMGLASTPEFYYVTRKFKAGVMVTASHLPKGFNGLKLCREKAIPIGKGSGMGEIKRMVLQARFPEPKRKGKLTRQDYLDEYIDFSLKFLKIDHPYRVVVDAGNGMGGLTYGALKRRRTKNMTLVPLYFELDGNFPNHAANPIVPQTLKDLQHKVLKERADLGIALDGDGDRCRLVDERGEVIPTEFTSALIAHELLHHHPGVKILFDVRSSRVLLEEIRESGGVPILCKAGHAYIKRKMRQIDAYFGSETPGHLYHREIDYVESTMIPLFRIMNLMSRTRAPLSALVKPFRRYAKIHETNFHIPSREHGQKLLAKARRKYGRSAKRLLTLDGLKFEYDDWWFSLRLSNTEPLIRLNLEADNQKLLRQRFKELKQLVNGNSRPVLVDQP